jgi:hypothetical protein
VGIQEGTNGQNPLVSIVCTPFDTEQTLTVAQTRTRLATPTAD